MDDLENPSNTLIFTELFNGTVGEDIDTNDDGTPDNLVRFGTIYDAIGIPGSADDDTFLYAAALGGTNLKYKCSDPRLIFRDANTDELYAINASDRIFDAVGVEVTSMDFDKDPHADSNTFGG